MSQPQVIEPFFIFYLFRSVRNVHKTPEKAVRKNQTKAVDLDKKTADNLFRNTSV